MGTVWQDVRYGVRLMMKKPGFAAVAILTLALGIGANTAIFSLVNALLLRPLPYRDSERLVMVWEHNRIRDRHQNVINPGNFLDWQERANSFAEMAAFADNLSIVTGAGRPEEIPTQVVTPNLFSLLGVEAIRGRTFTTEDGAPGRQRPLIISYGLWQRYFGGDPDIIGKNLIINSGDAPSTIVGVMPADFKWFVRQGSLVGKAAEMWAPMSLTGSERVNRRGRYMSAVARLKPAVTLAGARAEMTAIATRLEAENPDVNKGWGVEIVPLREQFTGDIRPALLILVGAVGFVLLISCANIANLLLARAAGRQREVAIRTALGATRRRTVRQLLTESVLLSLAGGALGLLLAVWGLEALVALGPPNLLDLQSVRLNLEVLGFTVLISFGTGIIFGLVPALEASRLDLNRSLKDGARGAGDARGRRIRGALVIAEVALGLVLLISAGLMVKSLLTLQAVDPGFDADHLLTMRVMIPGAKYPQDEQKTAFYRGAVERLQSMPGVESAGAVSYLPFAGLGAATSFVIVGRPEPAAGQKPVADVRVTDEHYFRTMRIPLLKGRLFTGPEAAEARHVAVINESLARLYWPGEDPLGKSIVVSMKERNEPTEIIGVVGDARYAGLDQEVRPMVYWPHPELAYASMTIVMRAKGDPLNLAAGARREIQELDKDQPIADVRTMNQWLADSTARARFSALLLALFAGVAAVLASVGIYGVMSYFVAQRTHEIGIRMALGAGSRNMLGLVIGQGLKLTSIGLGIGLLASFLLTRVMASLLYGVSSTDPVVFLGVPVLLAGVALLACFIPARRATKVDPLVALRYE